MALTRTNWGAQQAMILRPLAFMRIRGVAEASTRRLNYFDLKKAWP
jgi:hypothetical protein